MITWMQRHKKWLIITIWISTIAFIGAGFVGWGQYSYGDKAGAVAKVGDIEISMGELQKSYSRLYTQYNKAFQGNFDEEKAKQFGLQKQALQQLVQQALVLNLAKSYDLTISDKELFNVIRKQKAFYKNGIFDKELYKQVLSQNRLSIKEYEAELRKELLIEKTLSLLPVEISKHEANILNTLFSIADKINYKVLSLEDVKVDVSDEKLKSFWETMKNNFKTEVVYEIKYVKQEPVNIDFDAGKISQYYNANKTHFKDNEGKILPLEKAKAQIVEELNAKATKDKALRTYIAYKKGKLDNSVKQESKKISLSNNPFGEEAYKKISSLAPSAPFAKPVNVNGTFFIFQLISTTPSKAKSFEEAKAEVLPLYIEQTKKSKLLELANKSYKSFNGTTSDFITIKDSDKIQQLAPQEAAEFLQKLFVRGDKNSFVALNNGKIVLYNILEQKLLANSYDDTDPIKQIKTAEFNKGLIQTLQSKYQTEIFMKGL